MCLMCIWIWSLHYVVQLADTHLSLWNLHNFFQENFQVGKVIERLCCFYLWGSESRLQGKWSSTHVSQFWVWVTHRFKMLCEAEAACLWSRLELHFSVCSHIDAERAVMCIFWPPDGDIDLKKTCILRCFQLYNKNEYSNTWKRSKFDSSYFKAFWMKTEEILKDMKESAKNNQSWSLRSCLLPVSIWL